MPTPTKRPSHREAKKEECRRAIAMAALRLFESKGFEATTMDEIALASNVSRPTVFNYFAHKADILAVLGQLMGQRLTTLIARFHDDEPQASPVGVLRHVLASMAAAFAEYPETARAFHMLRMQQMNQNDWRRPPEHDPAMRGLLMQLEDLVRLAQQRGDLRSDFKPQEILRHLMIGMFASILGPWLQGLYGDTSLATLIDRHFDLLYQGLKG